MEEILNQLSNPFDMDSFKKLMDLYLESKDKFEFYAKIVDYYQDRSMEGDSKGWINLKDKFVNGRSEGHWAFKEYFSNFFPTEHRIYINSSFLSTAPITEMFIEECIKQNLPFELKYAVEKHSRSDGIVIGSNTRVYKKHIDILRKIAENHPELIEQCGTPHILTANLDNWMGLADENISNRYNSYTQSRINIFTIAIKKFLLKHKELGEQVEGFNELASTYEFSNNFILEMIKNGKLSQEDYEQELDKMMSERFALHIPLNRNDLKSLIQNNGIALSEIYEIFQKECEFQGIESDMPTLYKGSKEDLINFEHSTENKVSIHTDGKSPIAIVNEFFSEAGHNLSVEDELQLLRVIDDKFYANNELMFFIAHELYPIANQCLMNQDIVDFGSLFGKYAGGTSYDLLRDSLIQEYRNPNFPALRSMIVTEGENLSDENAKEIINMRIRQLYDYFNRPLESVEDMKKCIDNLQRMLDRYKDGNPYIDCKVESKFKKRIQYLEFTIENHDKLRQIHNRIASLLKDRTCTDKEIERLLESFKPKKILINNDFFDFEHYDEFDDDFRFMNGTPQYKLESIPEISSEGVARFEAALADYIDQGKDYMGISFSGQDIGKASYDANTSLCIDLSNVVENLQRGVMKNDPSK